MSVLCGVRAADSESDSDSERDRESRREREREGGGVTVRVGEGVSGRVRVGPMTTKLSEANPLTP